MRLFTDDSSSITDPFLRRAWILARNGLGTTSPNPMVGCVLVQGTEIVGEGWHERAGGPHAEAIALRDAGSAARGATVYVTLEPCAHHGRTPPCVDALIESEVARIVIGMPDPSIVASGGAERLSAAGIEVIFADDPAPFAALNRGWLMHVRESRPWITVKLALTLDARIAAGPGVRTRISGPGAHAVTMRLRAASDAVVIGARTAIADDPALTVRDSAGAPASRQPLRVVLTRRTDPDGCSLFGDGHGQTAVLMPDGCGRAAPAGARAIEYDSAGGVTAAMRALAAEGIAHVMVEPGQTLFTALWDEGLVDELVLVHAGGVGGEGWTGSYTGSDGGPELALRTRMKAVEAEVVGDDAITVWTRKTQE
ncbi:MAG: bifunctional diaminohydroxyphosphoribosylaminopyrimidine deaminase/5-amino-6-(5-phosphoribosylamino)uracil reductase RibD [Anaerosomatales bacterium]|nr:bifunctional diaminohydroxyphosphoribosylaminopyrimidine deaminase/5-amino-6-(5-phosphoribosylamino)uracil reductase RibD [Anaerosomatales bacterium]MDT8433464.1 bifunctional diaminohydroxyphosphoribosylaminopyrimidine deaminase/5-amino-6-(5-phosphoribosylamino)uracil reductase RibD [Anaerosomatales bacterium]